VKMDLKFDDVASFNFALRRLSSLSHSYTHRFSRTSTRACDAYVY